MVFSQYLLESVEVTNRFVRRLLVPNVKPHAAPPGRFGQFCEHLFPRLYGLRTPPPKGLSIIKSSRPVLIVGALKPNDLPSSIFHSSDRQSFSSSDHELEWACESIVGR